MIENNCANHEHTKAVIDRISRVAGHLLSVRSMVEEGRDCSQILIQLSAVRSAVNAIGKIILQDHINHCVVDAVSSNDNKVLEDLNEAIGKFLS